MLRGPCHEVGREAVSGSPDLAFPNPEEPFGSGDRPPGVRFYSGRLSFFLPYTQLQMVELAEGSLKLVYANMDVEIHGRALHALYVGLAEARVAWVVAQGDRLGLGSELATHIRRIDRLPR